MAVVMGKKLYSHGNYAGVRTQFTVIWW